MILPLMGFIAGYIAAEIRAWRKEQREAKERFDAAYEILAEKKEFPGSSDIHLLEVATGHIYKPEA